MNRCKLNLERDLWSCLAIVLLLSIWSSKISGSFWIDEAVSIWVANSTLSDLLTRATKFQGSSPFYYFIIWIMTKFSVDSELLFRLPSFLFILVGSYYLYKIADNLFDRYVAQTSIVVFISIDSVIAAGTNVRGYSLALALTLCAVNSLILWQKTNKSFYAFIFLISSALSFYSHYLFGLSFLFYIFYILTSSDDSLKIRVKRCFYLGIAYLLLISPSCFQLYLLGSNKQSLFFAEPPTFKGILLSLVQIKQFLALSMSVLIYRLFKGNYPFSFNETQNKDFLRSLFITIVWLILPILSIVLCSWLLGGSIFVERYFLWFAPAYAIIVGFIISLSKTPKTKNIIMTIFVSVVLVCNLFAKNLSYEGWREAIDYIRKSTNQADIRLFAFTGLVESSRLEWLFDENKLEYLLSPFSFYKLNVSKIVALPFPKAPGIYLDWDLYLSKEMNEALLDQKEIVLISRLVNIRFDNIYSNSEDFWIQEFLKYKLIPFEVKRFGQVTLIRFKTVHE